MQGDTAEYGPARAQKIKTGKWYFLIPVDHTTPQINQRDEGPGCKAADARLRLRHAQHLDGVTDGARARLLVSRLASLSFS